MQESSLNLSERQIEVEILFFLNSKDIFSWKVKTVGTFDTKRGVFRKASPLYKKGVADILGILPNGRFLAIEVKSEKGKLSPQQKEFLREIADRGGVAMVARSVKDVDDILSPILEKRIERNLDCSKS